MNSIDFIIILLLLWGAIMGFIKGFIVQSLTLVALVLGVWGGMQFSHFITDFLGTHYAMKGKMVPVLSFAIIFILVLIVMHFLSKLLSNLINDSVLGIFNRIGGIVFGILKMAFIVSIFFALLAKLDTKRKLITADDANQSVLYKPIEKIAPAIFPHLHFEELKNGLLKG